MRGIKGPNGSAIVQNIMCRTVFDIHSIYLKGFGGTDTISTQITSTRNSLTLPLRQTIRRTALTRADEERYSTTSMWMALMTRQVNKIAHRLLFAVPPLVRLVTTEEGPKVSTPTYVKGGAGSN